MRHHTVSAPVLVTFDSSLILDEEFDNVEFSTDVKSLLLADDHWEEHLDENEWDMAA